MKKLNIVAVLAMVFAGSTTVHAGAKDDYISAVVQQCKKTKAEAAATVVGGRNGNVMKFKLCTSATYSPFAGCTLKCSDASSKIGK